MCSGRLPPYFKSLGAPDDEITLEMSTAGSLVLSRIKDDVAEGSMALRDAVQLIYRAMRTAPASSVSAPILPSRFRQSLSATGYREMSQKPLPPEAKTRA
jgi:hypothetical protein